MSSEKFDNWVEKTMGDQDEFFYRYIYDAYLVIQNKSESGMYYELIPSNQGYILKNSVTKEVEFTLDSEEDRISLLNHFVSRFCKMSKDMKEWHDKRQQWHGDDMRNWGDTNKE